MEDDQGGYRLKVELRAELPSLTRDVARRIMEAAHLTCPYSKALRGDATVRLVVDDVRMVSA
jgi:organic hydroperoxide reductase OsmC/OhrA